VRGEEAAVQRRDVAPGYGREYGRGHAPLARSPRDGPAGRGGRLRLRLAAGPSPLSPGGEDRGSLGMLVAAGGAGRDNDASDAGPPGQLHLVPQPRSAGEDGRHGRRDQRRAADPRARRRLARAGVRSLWLPLRPSRQPLRGGARNHPRTPPRRRNRFCWAVLRGPRVRVAPARPTRGSFGQRPADLDRDDRCAHAPA
ncbi:MAG: POSSIBLE OXIDOREDUCTASE, partial [uncultured Thermomicrobiales bacterium]